MTGQDAERIINLRSQIVTLDNHQREIGNGLEVDQVRLHLQEIALGEIVRHRHRMGPLTEAQQYAVEALLISTADQISGKLIQRIQRYPTDVRAKYLNLWNPLPRLGFQIRLK